MSEEKILKRAIDTYGIVLQITTGMEEIGELIEALARLSSGCNKFFFRGKISIADLISELADVEMVCKTLRIIINDDISVNHIKQYKLKRLDERLDEFTKDKTEQEGEKYAKRRNYSL